MNSDCSHILPNAHFLSCLEKTRRPVWAPEMLKITWALSSTVTAHSLQPAAWQTPMHHGLGSTGNSGSHYGARKETEEIHTVKSG